jgi:hypothetical protein
MGKTRETETKEEVITARCDSEVKEHLFVMSKVENVSMSEVLAKSIREYYRRHFPGKSYYEQESRLFGRYGSGKGDLSVNRKRYLKEKLSEKYSRS